MKKWFIVSIVALVALSDASAHDYWLTPDSYFPAAKREVAVRLLVGDQFASDAERSFQRQPTRKLEIVTGDGTVDLSRDAVEGAKPFVRLTLSKAGPGWLRLDRGPHLITLSAEKFNAYLKEEGLEAILTRRREAGESNKEGRERYSRCLKCYLQVGDEHGKLFAKPLGQKLEIVPRQDPSALKKGDKLGVEVLLSGKPLVGAKIFALSRDEQRVHAQSAVTDKDGRATFRLERNGEWLVRLVHMDRCTDKDADWESVWAALTFGVK